MTIEESIRLFEKDQEDAKNDPAVQEAIRIEKGERWGQ